MQWEEFAMEFTRSISIGGTESHLRIGEASGWVTLVISLTAAFKSLGTLIGAITPDQINGWALLVGSLITGAIAVGTLAYTRVVRVRLEGSTLEEIYRANNRAIRDGRPVPYPAFMPGFKAAANNSEVPTK